MSITDFTKSAQPDALVTKAQKLNDQIESLGWNGALEVFRTLAQQKDHLSCEQQKLLLIEYLDTYLEVRVANPKAGDNILIALVTEARADARTDKAYQYWNRRALEEKFAIEQAVITRMAAEKGLNSTAQSALMSFDVNGLKGVNDKLGHEAGDQFLHHFAKVVSQNTRPNDVLFRIGGDEFVMIISGGDMEDCAGAIKNIRDALDKNPFIYEGTQITMKTGVGICLFDQTSNQADVMRIADEDLYEDKQVQPKSTMTKMGHGAPAGKDVLSFPLR